VTASAPPRAPSPDGPGDAPSRRRTYVAVILVQAITLFGLWVLQSYFGR
jgi:hypothetical protein